MLGAHGLLCGYGCSGCSCGGTCGERGYATSPGPTAEVMRLPVGPLSGLGATFEVTPLPDAQELPVTAAGKAFLDQAEARIAVLQSQAKAIGAPGFFDFGSSYGEKWTPVLDKMQALIADAGVALEDDPEAMHEFVLWGNKLNNAIAKFRLESPTKAAYEAALGVMTGNPFALWKFVKREAGAVVGLASDVKQAAYDTCSIYGVVLGARPLGDWWKNCVPAWARWTAYGLGLGAGALAVRKVYKIVS